MPNPIPTLANLKAYYRADMGLYQDTAGTTPATSNTNPIGRWEDQSGLGNHALAVANDNRPTLLTNSGFKSQPGVKFDTTSFQQWLEVASFAYPSGATKATIMAACQVDSGGGGLGVAAVTYSQPGIASGQYYSSGGAQAGIYRTLQGAVQSVVYDGTQATDVLRYRAYRNHAQITLAAGAIPTANYVVASKFYIGRLWADGLAMKGRILEVLYIADAISDADRALVVDYWGDRYFSNAVGQLIFSGDSRTVGSPTATNNTPPLTGQDSYPLHTRVLLGTTAWDMTNVGTNGQSWAGLASADTTAVDPLLDDWRDQRLVIFADANDFNTLTAVQTEGYCEAYFDDRIAAGWDPADLFCGVAPWHSEPTHQTKIADLATWQRTPGNLPAGVQVLDFQADPRFDSNADTGSADYSGDGVHLSNQGNAALGEIAAAALAPAGATITSAASGAWATDSTWVGGVAPTALDIAIIATSHTVTVSDTRTCAGWTVQGVGVLAITGAGSLTSTGDTTIEGNGGYGTPTQSPKVTIGAGGELLWAPDTGVTITHASGTDYYRHAELQARGTFSARCTIGKATGFAGLLIWRAGPGGIVYNQGFLDAEYTDFVGIGDATNKAFDFLLRYNTRFRLEDCTFDNCGWVDIAAWNLELDGSTGYVGVARTAWTDTQGSDGSLRLAISGPATVPVDACDFDRAAVFNSNADAALFLNLTDCIFRGTLTGNWLGSAVTSSGHLLYQRAAGRVSGTYSLPGTHTDCYHLADYTDDALADNPHFWAFSAADDLAIVGCVFEYIGAAGDTGDVLDFGAASGGTGMVRDTVVLPASEAGLASGAIWWLGGAGELSVEHCTVYSPGTMSGVLFPHGASMPVGSIPSIRSNIFWTDQGGSNYAIGYDFGTQATDSVTPAGVTANAFEGFGSGSNTVGGASTPIDAMDGLVLSTAPTGNLDRPAGAASFADATRNFLAWARTVRSHGGTDDVVRNAAVADIEADPTLTASSLLPWVRAGFMPGDAALRNAGHDAVTIGAVEMDALSIPTPVLAILHRRRRVG